MNAGGNSAGSTAHLTAEMLNQAVGIKSTVLTYRGGGPAVIALISGRDRLHLRHRAFRSCRT